MFKSANIGLAAAVLALALVGSLQGSRLRHLRESEAFYRWIGAAGTAESQGSMDVTESEEGKDFVDDGFFVEVADKMDPELGDLDLMRPERDGKPVSVLAVAAQEASSSEDKVLSTRIWGLASSSQFSNEREEFLAHARGNELYFAQNIQYAQMLQGQVGVFQMFLGFRKVAANFIWLEVDRLWHQGIVHRMIPLMKTCVVLDPQFVDAYLLGAWHLSYNVTAKMQETPYRQREWSERFQTCIGDKNRYYYIGVDFLRNGIAHNPHDYRLYFDLGFGIYAEKLHNYGKAVEYLSQAVRQRHDIWVPRQLYICMEKNGQYQEALNGWTEYAKQFPETTTGKDVAPRMIERNKGHILEQRYHDKMAEADAATGAQAEKLKEEALQYRERAKEIWMTIREPFAQARLLRLEAEDYESQGRYLEASAKYDEARYADLGDQNWNYCSDKIIEVKLKGGLPLSISEKKAIVRESESDRCQGQPEGAVDTAKTEV